MDKRTMMENLVREAHERGAFTGTWLYAENGEIVTKGAVGWRDPENMFPMREDSIFDLASVSKNFTATAVMLLRRKGLISLEDEITAFFPEIPYRGVTIRHLLNHTGGLPDYMDWVGKKAEEENRIPGNDIIVRFLAECGEEAEFAPGEKWEYSNTGYCLLAQIVEKVSGVPYEEYLEKNIFAPAGMKSTHVLHRRKDGLSIDNLAYGMVTSFGSDEWVLADDSPENHHVVPLDGVSGDGLVHSNIFDLLAWDRALREEKVLTKEEQMMMYTPGKLNSGETTVDSDEDGEPGYGFGWDVLNDPEHGLIVCHSGGWPGYTSWYQRFVDEDKVLIILRSREDIDFRASDAFFAGMKAIARGEEPKPIRTVEELAVRNPDRGSWESLIGRYDYDNPDIGFAIHEILMKDGDLYGKVSYKDRDYELKIYPLSENIFAFRDTDDFTLDENGLTLWGVTGKKTEE